MTKPAITKRSTKGSHLTFSELDANFQNLSDATFGLQAGTGGTTVNSDLNGKITLVAGDGVTLSGDDTANTVTIASTSGITDVVEDTTPQLGGDLDVNGYKITSASNANVVIEPNGTGDIYLTADKTWLGDAGAQTVVTTNGDNQLVIGTNNNFTDHTLTFNTGGAINIKTKAAGAFDVSDSGNKVYFLVDASNQIITNFVSDQSTYRSQVYQTKDYHKISTQNNTGTTTYTSVEVNRTGLKLNNQTWPAADGTSNQILRTNGTGTLSWSTFTGGIAVETHTNDYNSSSSNWIFTPSLSYQTHSIKLLNAHQANSIPTITLDLKNIRSDYNIEHRFLIQMDYIPGTVNPDWLILFADDARTVTANGYLSARFKDATDIVRVIEFSVTPMLGVDLHEITGSPPSATITTTTTYDRTWYVKCHGSHVGRPSTGGYGTSDYTFYSSP